MKNKISLILIAISISSSITSIAQVGIGTTNPNSSAKLDVTSTTKGFLPPRMTYAQKNAIASPTAGLMIWCTDCGLTGEMQVYNGSAWTNISGTVANNPTSNGTALVSSYTCATASTGIMTTVAAVTSVTQTITATVTSIGSYSLTTIANGVTFAASGTFTGTGNQDIVLNATGTPTAAGTNTFTLNTSPNCNFSRTTINYHPSSNGSAIVTNYICSTASAGIMSKSVATSGVTQTITATVNTLGTYSISTTANGVTFAGSGTFAGTGSQNILLTATGTPIDSGSNSFTLNTTPNCSFSRTTNLVSSNGSAIISSFTCSGYTSGGYLLVRAPVSSVTQNVTANVSTVGTYNITAAANGVSFTGSGTFAGTGSQSIVLTATGTPISSGNHTFTLNTTPNCSFTRTTADTVVSANSRVWMDRNLGATQVATNSTDALSYGDLFQWGRCPDGHQIRTSGITPGLSSTNIPGHSYFIYNSNFSPWDWRSPQNANLWQGLNGINNPCPVGYRVPTITELETEGSSWSAKTSAGAFNSPLKLSCTGYRISTSASFASNGTQGYYWSSSANGAALSYYFQNVTVTNNQSTDQRGHGFSIRCIKD